MGDEKYSVTEFALDQRLVLRAYLQHQVFATLEIRETDGLVDNDVLNVAVSLWVAITSTKLKNPTTMVCTQA